MPEMAEKIKKSGFSFCKELESWIMITKLLEPQPAKKWNSERVHGRILAPDVTLVPGQQWSSEISSTVNAADCLNATTYPQTQDIQVIGEFPVGHNLQQVTCITTDDVMGTDSALSACSVALATNEKGCTLMPQVPGDVPQTTVPVLTPIPCLNIQVFKHVRAVLSEDILVAIPGSQSIIFQAIQTDFDVQFAADHSASGEKQIYVDGSFSVLSKVKERLELVCGISDSSDNCNRDNTADISEINPSNSESNAAGREVEQKNETKPETQEAGTSCELLMPMISQRGRQIKPHPNYLNYLQTVWWMDGEDWGSRRGRRRKCPPQRFVNKSRIHNGQAKSATRVDTDGSVAVGVMESVESKSLVNQRTDEVASVTASAICHSTIEYTTSQSENPAAIIYPDPLADPPTTYISKQIDLDPGIMADPPHLGNHDKTGTSNSRKRKNYEALAPFKFFCKKCSFQSKRHSHFLAHKRLHDKLLEVYRCKTCNFTTLRLSHLRRHEVTHSAQTFHCNSCQYKTDQLRLLQRHKNAKHNPLKKLETVEPLPCPRCTYSTTRLFHYQRHLRTQHPNLHESEDDEQEAVPSPSYQCEECDYKASRKEHYIRHKNNVHSNRRPFLCDLCGKSFKRPDALAQHKVTHIDKQQRTYAFKCNQCTKGFRSQAHLNEHVAIHSGQRAYLCDICGTSFKTRSVQRKHIQTIHLNPRAFPCDQCEKRFNTKFALNRHRSVHDTPGMRVLTLDHDPGVVTEMNVGDVTEVTGGQILGTEVATVVADHLSIEQPQETLTVIAPSMGETFEQTEEGIQHTYIQQGESRTALLYLTIDQELSSFQ